MYADGDDLVEREKGCRREDHFGIMCFGDRIWCPNGRVSLVLDILHPGQEVKCVSTETKVGKEVCSLELGGVLWSMCCAWQEKG